jgi:Uma2 family endonuclease
MNAVSAPLRYLVNVEQYHRMGEAGIIPPDTRVELIEGEVLTMPPIGSRHASAVAVLNRLLQQPGIVSRAFVWPQNPVVLSQMSEPQPDIALIRQRADDYREASPQPHDVLLLIEVSDSSLTFDRQRKVPLYARCGISETWILNLPERCLEVFREPAELGYTSGFILRGSEPLAPAAFPDSPISWADALG